MAAISRTANREQEAPAARLRLGTVLLVAGLAVVVIAALQIVLTSGATTTSFAIQRLSRQKLELETTMRQLEADVAFLSSLGRLEQEAKRLGLRPARRETVQVNVAWPGAGRLQLPTRLQPQGSSPAATVQQDSPWWRDLLRLLPFN